MDQRHKIGNRDLGLSELAFILCECAAWAVTARSHKDCEQNGKRETVLGRRLCGERSHTTKDGSEGFLKLVVLELRHKGSVQFCLYSILSFQPTPSFRACS